MTTVQINNEIVENFLCIIDGGNERQLKKTLEEIKTQEATPNEKVVRYEHKLPLIMQA